MKTYWNIVFGCAGSMLVLLLLPFTWHWCAAGVAACIFAGLIGAWLGPHVPEMHAREGWVAAGYLLSSSALQSVGLLFGIYWVWALGLMLTLALPLATFVHDIKREEAARREAFA